MTTENANIQINEERLLSDFIYWAKINAPSKSEKVIADLLVAVLKELNFTLSFDEGHHAFGGNCGNLIAYWEGTDPSLPPLFLSTHMDTVLPTEGLNPVIRDGIIYSDGSTILGADDRAALAAYIEAIRTIQEQNIPCGPIELILTVNEQQGLQGAKYLDYSKVQSKCGYIFDSSGDVGQIILQGPYSSRFYIDVHGRASHIGLNPEEGINAFVIAADILMQVKLGKIDDNTLANIGIIEGGELASIIPGHVKMIGEVRCFDKDGLDHTIDGIVQNASEIATRYGGKIEAEIEKKYLGFKIQTEHLLVKNAVEATAKANVIANVTKTLGGADTNILNENGLTCITLGNGFRNIHTFQEHISIENLMNTAKYSVALIQSWYYAHKNN